MKYAILSIAIILCTAWRADAQTNFANTQRYSLQRSNSAASYTSQQARSSVYNVVPTYTFSSVNRGLFSGATKPPSKQKPFSQVTQGPSTSPYMGLLSSNPYSSSTTNYFTNVRPQLDQQKMNQRLMEQNIKMQRQLNSVAARPPYDPTGSENRAPTGHAAVYQNNGGVYGNHGGYYPQAPIRSVRGQR